MAACRSSRNSPRSCSVSSLSPPRSSPRSFAPAFRPWRAARSRRLQRSACIGGWRTKLVVVPQAMRLIVPPLTSQYLNLDQEFVARGIRRLSGPGSDFRRHGAQPDAGGGAGDGDHDGGLSADLARGGCCAQRLQRALRLEGAVSVSERGRLRTRCGRSPWIRRRLFARARLLWARTNLFSSVASSLTTLAFVALALWLLPPLVALGDDRRGLERAGRRALPRASGRRLLGVHRRQARLPSLRLLSGRRSAGGWMSWKRWARR